MQTPGFVRRDFELEGIPPVQVHLTHDKGQATFSLTCEGQEIGIINLQRKDGAKEIAVSVGKSSAIIATAALTMP